MKEKILCIKTYREKTSFLIYCLTFVNNHSSIIDVLITFCILPLRYQLSVQNQVWLLLSFLNDLKACEPGWHFLWTACCDSISIRHPKHIHIRCDMSKCPASLRYHVIVSQKICLIKSNAREMMRVGPRIFSWGTPSNDIGAESTF